MNASQNAPWKSVLADPGKNGHIVQLYQDDAFCAEAVAHFTAEGLARNESVILVATKPHWAIIAQQLRSRGSSPEELLDNGQVALLDADETLAKFMRGELPDGDAFKSLARSTIARTRVRSGGRSRRVRLWGEMVNILYVNGNLRGAIRLEELFDEIVREEGVAVFCSFLMDKFDPRIYDHAFGEVCRTHSHVIPAADYASHRATVDRAIAEVVGDIRDPLFKSLISWNEAPTRMPTSQAIVVWLKDHMPQCFDAVLARARELEAAEAEQRA